MKASLMFVTLTVLTASLPALGMSELEQLRSRCAAQEEQIRKLEAEVKKLRPSGPASMPVSNSKPDSSGGFSSYLVKKGDSLGRIASRHRTTPEALARMNNLKMNSVIHPGQKLRVPATGGQPGASSIAGSPVADSYTIQEGDTYSSISRQTGIPVSSLMAANPQVKATGMRPGQTIRLTRNAAAPAAEAKAPTVAKTEPTSTVMAKADPRPVQSPSATEQGRPAPVAQAAPGVPAEMPASVAGLTSPAAADSTPSPEAADRRIRPVMIDGEMTYGEFASQHGTDIDRLNDLNGLDLTSATVLARGSELYVPAQP